jgi:flagellar P-ring protein precursor FlgI
MTTMHRMMRKMMGIGVLAAVFVGVMGQGAYGLRIRDAVRLKNEAPNELTGMGLVLGLPGTGDGDDYLPAMRPLAALLGQFDDAVKMEKELKNTKNVAIVTISMTIPPQGVHSGERMDITVSSLAAKDLRGGRLVFVPLYAPTRDVKMILASASGDLPVDGTNKTKVVIHNGGTMIEDVLPEDVRADGFTLVLHPQLASRELAAAIADQINEDVDPQTNGRKVAVAVDATSVEVTIPAAERGNPTPYIARLLTLPLPTLPEPAKVTINLKDKLITFSDEVEVAPTMICQGNLTITIGAGGAAGTRPAGGAAGSGASFVVLDPHGTGNAKLKDLQNAFNLLKVSADDRIAIVKGLARANALKAELVIE